MKRVVPLLVATACLAACGGAGTSMPTAQAPVAVAPTPPTGVDFTAFTKAVVSGQSDTAMPVAVTAAEFVFPDNDNPTAFAAVLPGT